MAARLTKLFLQNCASTKEDASKPNKRSSAKSKAPASSSRMSKKARRKLKAQQSKKVSGRSKVKVLEAARRELEQADRTAQNLRKLKSIAPAKSQRLLEKVLAQRTAAFR
uniref:Uncharacterized protein n=1 Tax=Peronospora matthiolae TaxID=2874970 RepID=A0AAV1U6G9_9STRA